MSNVTIEARLKGGQLAPFIDEGESCANVVELITGDDCRPPAISVCISIKTSSGKKIDICFPNEHNALAKVKIDGDEIA